MFLNLGAMGAVDILKTKPSILWIGNGGLWRRALESLAAIYEVDCPEPAHEIGNQPVGEHCIVLVEKRYAQSAVCELRAHPPFASLKVICADFQPSLQVILALLNHCEELVVNTTTVHNGDLRSFINEFTDIKTSGRHCHLNRQMLNSCDGKKYSIVQILGAFSSFAPSYPQAFFRRLEINWDEYLPRLSISAQAWAHVLNNLDYESRQTAYYLLKRCDFNDIADAFEDEIEKLRCDSSIPRLPYTTFALHHCTAYQDFSEYSYWLDLDHKIGVAAPLAAAITHLIERNYQRFVATCGSNVFHVHPEYIIKIVSAINGPRGALDFISNQEKLPQLPQIRANLYTCTGNWEQFDSICASEAIDVSQALMQLYLINHNLMRIEKELIPTSDYVATKLQGRKYTCYDYRILLTSQSIEAKKEEFAKTLKFALQNCPEQAQHIVGSLVHIALLKKDISWATHEPFAEAPNINKCVNEIDFILLFVFSVILENSELAQQYWNHITPEAFTLLPKSGWEKYYSLLLFGESLITAGHANLGKQLVARSLLKGDPLLSEIHNSLKQLLPNTMPSVDLSLNERAQSALESLR